MIDWLHSLPVGWLVVIVFAATAVIATAIHVAVTGLATGERGVAFAAVSPGLLPPMALIFGLLVGFLAAQVWSDSANAQTDVNREASSLRSVLLLSAEFPSRQSQMRELIRRQIDLAVTREWPAMARRSETLAIVPAPSASALHLALALPARTPGQIVAQREIVTSLENALDARRQRIIVSRSSVNWAKWAGVITLGLLTLLAVAFVHSANRRTAAIAIALFAAAIAVCVLMIGVQDRPFSGPFRIKPTVLVQIEP
jgi:hypothetical protein